MKRFKCLVHLNAKVSLGAIVMGLFKRFTKDKCFPYGEEEVNGEIPVSFPEHDLRPVREDHISRLGAHFDWVKECSRCGYEDLGLEDVTPKGMDWLKWWILSEPDESTLDTRKSELMRRLDEVDALVQTFPYFFGPLRIQEGPQDNCCAVSTQKSGWHSIRKRGNKELIAEYKTEYLSDPSPYVWDKKGLKGSFTSTVGNGWMFVWECTYCTQLVKQYVEIGDISNLGD